MKLLAFDCGIGIIGSAFMKKDAKSERRSRVSQTDVPAFSLDEALAIPFAIADNYAFGPIKPLQLAAALSLSPTSSRFRMLAGSAIAYGLTDGGYNASAIASTPLAKRIVQPTIEGEDSAAKQEAFLKPRVLREFLAKYNGNKLPREDIALNVLTEFGVPRDSTKRTLALIIESGRSLGLFTDIKGQLYVNLNGINTAPVPDDGSPSPSPLSKEFVEQNGESIAHHAQNETVNQTSLTSLKTENRKVFISHGRNRAFIDALKELLSFGELEPVVSVENESVSQPVPDKVMSDMRRCSAAIIHVDSEQNVIIPESEQKSMLNPNVLIEIGAALALYGRRFVLLVRHGAQLPSNLQGLYEVRYHGDKLDGDVTIRLLKAIRDIKNHPLPLAT